MKKIRLITLLLVSIFMSVHVIMAQELTSLATVIGYNTDLMKWKAMGSTGTLSFNLNGTNYTVTDETSYQNAYNSVYNAMLNYQENIENDITTATTVTGDHVWNIAADINMTANVTVKGRLVVLGGKHQITASNDNQFTVSGTICMQGDVVLDGGGSTQHVASNGAPLVSGSGNAYIYLADKFTLQNNYGGGINNYGKSVYIVGGVIGTTDVAITWSDGNVTHYLDTQRYPSVASEEYVYIKKIETDGKGIKHGAAVNFSNGSAYFAGCDIVGNDPDDGYTQQKSRGCIRSEDGGANTGFFEIYDVFVYGNVVKNGTVLQEEILDKNVFCGGKIVANYNPTGYCSGLTCTRGKTTLKGSAMIVYNTCEKNGGGALVDCSGTMVLSESACVSHNTAVGSTTEGGGGGIRVIGTMIMNGGVISYNLANGRSGAQTNRGDGGGIYATTDKAGGALRIARVELNAGTIHHNKASHNGGGLYISCQTADEGAKSIFKMDGTEIRDNVAFGNGGGAYVSATGGELEAKLDKGALMNNISYCYEGDGDSGNGGGLYFELGSNAKSGSIIIVEESTSIEISGNKAEKDGGGIFMNNKVTTPGVEPVLTMNSGCKIFGNEAGEDGRGGAFCVCGGQVAINDGYLGYKDEGMSPNVAKLGGGLYLGGGTVSIKNGYIENNVGVNGAGIYVDGGEATISDGSVQYNQASANGGGLYVAKNSSIDFENGTFTDNSAKNGGGIYVASGGSLTMTGTSNITGNHTDDASGQGGGVYMDGTMNVSGTSLHVWDNHPGNTAKQSNVYLPDYDDFITMTGRLSGTAKVGISVPTVPTPVIYSADRSVLQEQYEAFQDGSSQLVDDRGIFDAIYSRTPPYDLDHIFFLGTWRKYIAKTVEDPSPYADGEAFKDINTSELLATYLCYVNGFPPFAEKHSGAAGTVTADLDMGEYLWTSIGTCSVDDIYSTDPFSGTFDGQGHVISNLRSEGLIGYSDYGLFGKVSGGTVKNVFLKDSDIATNEADHVGILAAEAANATILNCEGAGTITVTEEGSTMGGLVGTASGSTKIVNSMAMAEMKGGSTMGGLVGEMASGTLENSFANPKFSEAHGHVGGLVGENAGTVSNCYARLRGDAPSGFGYLAGSNSGTVRLSYCPTGGTAIGSGTAGTGLDTYSPTGAYTYGDLGGNLLSDGTTCLLDKLNANAASATGYATWTRTSGSAINGDYPILMLGYESACSADGIVLQYGSLDQSLARLTSGDVLLYGSASCTRSKPAGVNLYIDEDASLVSSSDALDAYVGVTLKSPEVKWYWHQFSTPLSAAPIGITYTDPTTPYGPWDEPSAISFTADGYIPVGTDPANVDFYCFYEPEYHWINFKRNSASHWHQDEGNAPIHYDNESVMPKGKGYLLALGATTFVQSHGTLNNGDVSIAVTVSGAHLTGYNLLGNPYQSYLDFDEFAEANDGILSSGKYANSYLIFDEAENAYLTYTAGASKGAATASRYIHPHQGFYIQASGSGTAQFTDGMRAAAPAGGSSYRGGGMNYPLVNLFVADEGGKRDVLVIELDRPELSGARKMAELKNGEGSIYARSEGNDYSILFAKGHVTEQPVRFHADSEGEFTLSWDTQNGVFTYLHLIDNLDGTDTDCLACDGYSFSATPGDYESRFRLVMQYEATEYGIGEHDCTAASSFAFISDGELVISNEGRANLQVIDMTGRIIRNQQVEGDCRISTDGMAAGVYVISLNGNIQKIVVK